MSIIRKSLLVVSVAALCLLLVSVALADVGHVDTTVSNFSAGTVGSCFVGPSTSDGINGEVTLLPTMASDFSGGSLPSGWITQTWQSGGSVTVNGGQLTVDNAAVYGPAVTSASSIEYMGLFTNTLYQFGGFSSIDPVGLYSPWASPDTTRRK